jgi:hypothetical protein
MTWVRYEAQNWVQQETKTNEILTEVHLIQAEIDKYRTFQRIAGDSIPHDAIDAKISELVKLCSELTTLAEYQYVKAEKARKDEWG